MAATRYDGCVIARERPRLRGLLVLLSAVAWLGWFSPEISDTGFWWQRSRVPRRRDGCHPL